MKNLIDKIDMLKNSEIGDLVNNRIKEFKDINKKAFQDGYKAIKNEKK